MARTGRGAIDQDGDWLYHMNLDADPDLNDGIPADPIPPEEDYVVIPIGGGPLIYNGIGSAYTSITVWGFGLISFGDPTPQQLTFVANSQSLTDFPGPYIAVNYLQDIDSIEVGIKQDFILVNYAFEASVRIFADRIVFSGAIGNGGIDLGTGLELLIGNNPSPYTADLRDFIVRSFGNGAEVIAGTAAPQSIFALDGNDTITAGAGAVKVTAGLGNDSVTGGSGKDSILGNEGDDTIVAGAGDFADGGDGNDLLIFDYRAAGAPVVTTIPGAGGSPAGGVAFTGFERFGAIGSDYNDTITGSVLGDVIFGGAGVDLIQGGGGADTIDAGLGGTVAPPVLTAGGATAGSALPIDDLFFLFGNGSVPNVPQVNFTTSVDSNNTGSTFNVFSIDVPAGAELTITSSAGAGDILEANVVIDVVNSLGQSVASDSRDGDPNGIEPLPSVTTTLAAGHYTIAVSVDGSFSVDGTLDVAISLTSATPPTANKLQGNAGDDLYYIYALSDQVIELNDEGTDTVVSAVSLTIPDFVEVLTLGGGAIDATGSARAESLIGNGAANTLNGLGGNDTLDGAGGSDTAVFSGKYTNYTISAEAGGFRLVDTRAGANDGSDLVLNVEDFNFADGIVSAANLIPNSVPTAPATKFVTTQEDTASGPIAIGAADADGDPLSYSIKSGAAPPQGSVVFSAGAFTYTPNADVNGADSFTIVIQDGKGASVEQAVSVTIDSVNDAPVADADGDYEATEDINLLISVIDGVLAGDSDVEGGTLTAQLVSTTTHGTLALSADGSFSYSPEANYSGTDSFSYQAKDSDGALSVVQIITINVLAVNDDPDAVDDGGLITAYQTPLVTTAGTLLGNDTDIDGDTLSVTSVQAATHGTVGLADDKVTFTPDAGYSGPASYTYTILDGQGGTDIATVSLTVNAADNINVAPIADADGPYSASEDTKLTVSAANGVLTGDTDGNGDPLTAQLVTATTHGALVLGVDGSFTYTPDANYNGSDSFSYQARDPSGALSVVRAVSIIVNVNNDPDAVNDTGRVILNSPVTISVLANDTDSDGDLLSIAGVGSPGHGTAVANAGGTITYTPTAGYKGADSFTYAISDGKGGTDTAIVSLEAAQGAAAQTILTPGQSYGVTGFPSFATDVFITGTAAGHEFLSIGDFTTAGFSNNFTAGGDTIRLAGLASDFTVSVSGNQVNLVSTVNQTDLKLPVGFNTITIIFESAPGNFNDSRIMRFVADGVDADLLPDLFLGAQRFFHDAAPLHVLAFA